MPEFLQSAIEKTVSQDSSIVPTVSQGNEAKKFEALSQGFKDSSPLNNAFNSLANSIATYIKSPLPNGKAPQPTPEQTNESRIGNTPSLSR